MGKATQYRNWAITFNTGSGKSVLKTPLDGFRLEHAGLNYTIYVGDEEPRTYDDACYHVNASTHQHILAHCASTSVSRTKVRNLLEAYTQFAKEEIEIGITYMERVDTPKDYYKRYVYKSSTYNKTPYMKYDYMVYVAIQEMNKLTPVYEDIRQELINRHGVKMFDRQLQAVLEVYKLGGTPGEKENEEPYDFLYDSQDIAGAIPVRPVMVVAPFPETMLTPRQLYTRARDRRYMPVLYNTDDQGELVSEISDISD